MGDTGNAPSKEPKKKETKTKEPGAKAAKPDKAGEKKDDKKAVEKADAKDGKAKAAEKPKVKADEKSKAKADSKPKPKADEKPKAKADEKPKPKADEKSKAKADEKPKVMGDDKSKPKADDKSKAKAEEKPKAKEEKPKAKDSKAKKAPAAAAAAEASERKAAAATAAATAAASKKRKKDEVEETPEEGEDDDTRKLQEGVVEDEPEGKAKQPKGACAAEALDVDDSDEQGPPPKAAKRSSAKPGQVDGSQSHDPGDEEEDAEPEKDGKDKEKEKGKSKAKTKEKGKDKERGKGKKKKDKTSYSYEEDSGSSDASAARRKKRRANAGLRAASGFGLAPPPAAEASSFGLAPTAAMAVLPAPVAGLLTSDVATDLQRMRLAVEAATGKTMEPRLKLDQREEEQEQALSMAEDLRDALLDPSNQKQLLTRTSLLSVTQAEDGRIVLRAPSKQSLKDAMSVLARVAHHCSWGCSSTKVGLLLREKPEKVIHTVVIRLAATSSRMQTQEGRVNLHNDKLRIGTDAHQCQVVVEAIPGVSRKHATITFEQDKGACYVQDMSTNGTRLNGKRLPRPPYKHPMDARVRIFHGDELVLAVTPEGEELGYVINLHELSG